MWSELLRGQPVAGRLSDAAINRVERVHRSRRWVGYGLLVLLVGLALLVLILRNLVLGKLGLYGELVYAIMLLALALWALGQTRVARAALGHFSVDPFSFKRALIWSAFLLVAIPVAIVHWPYGPVVLALGPAVAVLLYLVRRPGDPPLWRSPWLSAGGGLVLVLVVAATVAPRIGTARPATDAPVPSPESTEDRRLAMRVRPILLFDEVEQRFPINIDALIARKQVRACREAVFGDPCPHVTRADGIDLGADYLKFEELSAPRGGDEDSAYYYRVVDDEPEYLYVDYWWFFARNPSPVAAAVFCAPGFRLPGLTCHEHESDWEGVTVVLGQCEPGPSCIARPDGSRWTPVAVRYAQHELLASYAWSPTLVRLWRGVRRTPTRPVVFIARDSHASYPFRCRRLCRQIRLGLLRREGRHDGRTPWVGNFEGCKGCLLRLPVTGDDDPASWNAFEGRWGAQSCLLGGSYCDRTGAPNAPSEQGRYDEPAQAGPWFCLVTPTSVTSRRLEQCADAATPQEFLE